MKFLGPAALAINALFSQAVSADSLRRNPLQSVGRIQHPTFLTASHRVHAYSHFQLTFSISNREHNIRLSLEPNHDAVAPGATISYLSEDGSIRRTEPINRLEHRVFRGRAFVQYPGQIEWINAGWARIHVHRDGPNPLFEGAFQVYGDHHHIQTGKNYDQTRHRDDPALDRTADADMVIWRDLDITESPTHPASLPNALKRASREGDMCTSDQLSYNTDEKHPVYRSLGGLGISADRRPSWSSVASSLLFGRQMDGITGGNSAGVNLASTIGSTSGCPSAKKVALIGIATDCTYTAAFSGNESALRTNVITQVNSASELFENTFSISLGIQNLTVSSQVCPSTPTAEAPWNVACSDSVSLLDRLNLFSQWRGQHQDTNAYWSLLSTCGTDAAVGLAWLGQLCMAGTSPSSSDGNETVAAANVVVRTSNEWQVFAHETGHTFGAVHDCTATTCADGTVTRQQCCPLSSSTCDTSGQFIMNPSTGSGITQFSPCSIGNICSALGRQSVRSSCLTNNKDVPTITGSQCGNGIVESGEECDCGGASGCGNNPCCDPATCRFTSSSICDPTNEECCTEQCQFSSNGTVCRASTGTCGSQETCSGTSSVCPGDQNAPDGTSCGTGLQCASGQCTSRDQQCQSLMGSLTTNNDTVACGSLGCRISCQSPQFGDNVCYTMNQNFLDGTSCGGGGRCDNGMCEGASATQEIRSWIDENKDIVIPVAVVVGVLLLAAITSCLFNRGRRRRRRAGPVSTKAPKPPPQGWGHVMPPPPPPASSRETRADWGYHAGAVPPPYLENGYTASRGARYA